ncbi:GntR family transcriptional regulator [Novosphingobium sp. AAP1]|uniref:FadR/GntR family transcriptional regulator n=1 Tax=Novosphingobium sp. AAP1 TaxID=1523413 RepID=UPI0006B8CEB5|nr:FCD domain-containing protein [Novosphingobium sp. AAP1]KPF56362.1 GntR family transcriptional regulator [Novosphingobium sp. AAP1]
MIKDDLVRLRALLDQTVERGEDRLPPEPKLSDELGISRGRLRTLLKRLESEGEIWRHVGKGTFVGPRKLIDSNPVAVSFSVDDILQARTALEPQLAALAAIHSTSEDVAEMDACLAEMKLAPSMLHWKRLDERLHRAIAQATRNNLLLTLYDTLRTQMKFTLDSRIDQVFGAEPGPKADTDSEHAQVVDAIRRHDPAGAETLMREHLFQMRGKLFGLR